MNTDNPNRKQRSQPLRRGKACLNCRHLKIKCDGVRPVCGQCKRVPKDDPCEFTDSMSRTQELEHTVYRLQSRIDELQGGAGPSNYARPSHYPGPNPGTEFSARSSPFSGSSGSQSSPSTDNSFLGFQEPPFMMVQMLIQYFLPHATQFGFFLHAGRFRDSALLSLPFGDERRPSPALLCAVYLWGVHLSQSQPLLSSEPVFLKRAQQHISTEISANAHPTHFLHTIQAQVLLATYLFRTKHFLEAEFYANGAATLALGYQLHKIRSSRASSPPLLGVPLSMEVYPAPPADAVAEGERIRGFWAVTTLQSNLNVALGSPSGAFCILESAGAEIDTPWPLEIADYEAGLLPAGHCGQESVRHFLTDDQLPASPICMMHAKASVLLYRAARLGSNYSANLQPQERAAYTASHTWLDTRITQFWETLPQMYAVYGSPDADVRTLVLARALTAAALIKLHRGPAASDPQAQARCVFAARAVLSALSENTDAARLAAHPVVGALAALGCRVLMDAIRRARAAWAAGFATGFGAAEEGTLLADLQGGMATMGAYAAGSPLIEYQLKKLRQQYDTM